VNAILSLLKGPLLSLALALIKRYKKISIEYLKIQGAIYYVKGVRAVRQSVVALVLVMVLMSVIAAGFVILHVGFALLIHEYTKSLFTTGVILASLGGFYLLVPLCIVVHLTSEKTWMRLTNADKIINGVIKRENVR
jgi:hypothetical protein